MARILEIARSLTRCQPNASACAPAATLVRSIDSRCRIHRVQRRVVFARGSAICGMRCWKILVAHSGLSQMKRGNRTCSFVGWPTIGRSVSLRSMWSRSRPGLSQSAQIGSMLTGEQNKCVNSPATAASSMVTPSSTVRQMLSASRLAVAFKAGPGDLRRWREEPSSSHAPGPLHLVPHGLRAGPLATHSETGRAGLRPPTRRYATPSGLEHTSNNYRLPVISFRRDGVSRTMSVHRFALLLAYGDDMDDTVAEHRCNEPLCVRVDQEHVITSTQSANLRYAVSLGRAGAHRAPTGGRTRAERSLAVRDAIAGGWDPIAYARAAGETRPTPTPRLF